MEDSAKEVFTALGNQVSYYKENYDFVGGLSNKEDETYFFPFYNLITEILKLNKKGGQKVEKS